MNDLIQLRHKLHQNPEIAGEERETSQKILEFIKPLSPDIILEGLGGEGLAFVFKGKKPGNRLLFRCELDALPIEEYGMPSYRSKSPEKAHLCGHDGHMAIICGLAQKLAVKRPVSGEVVLLFQPAEETGEGAKRVLGDPRFESIRPDFAFALHNLPGFPKHQIITRNGTFAAGSTGVTYLFEGKTSHAAHPADGINPATAISKMILDIPELVKGFESFALATVIQVSLGSLAFGTSAGSGSLSLTLRAFDQNVLEQLIDQMEEKAKSLAEEARLGISIEYQESFAVSTNHPKASEIAELAFGSLGMRVYENPEPFRWSEDFGLFSQSCPSYLFGIGAGENCPQLHEPTYDFPDELIETGVQVFEKIIQIKTLQGL